MTTIYCACCGRPFKRKNAKGAAPRYCSDDCRKQMAVRRSAWAEDWRHPPPAPPPAPPSAGLQGDD
jgi:endogenous inhibitor of DNA gyrase (YacG/DUF329 family)